MRSEKEILDLIIKVAKEDDRVRAVILNGSRANPLALRDRFQDFDVVYLVSDVQSFKKDPTWIDVFGERMILQLPDDMEGEPIRTGYAYLMQFMDGNRIDLGLEPVDEYLGKPLDSLSLLLMDKDGRLPPFPPPSEKDYLPKPPTVKQYLECCNEFWWVSLYVAKGLWRIEITYAMAMLEIVRCQLMKMLTWQIGIQTGFSINPGKEGKYFRKYLSPGKWQELLKTFPMAEKENMWEALFSMGGLFRESGRWVGSRMGFDYPFQFDKNVTPYLQHIRDLPAKSVEIY